MDEETPRVEAWQEHDQTRFSTHVAKAKNKRDKPKNIGCAGKVCKAVRSCWATPYTEKNATKEQLIKYNIRELFLYIIFLTTACIITFDMTSSTYYYYTKVMQELFLDSSTADGVTFRSINNLRLVVVRRRRPKLTLCRRHLLGQVVHW